MHATAGGEVADRVVDALDIAHAHLGKLREKLQEDTPRHLRVVARTVVVEVPKVERARHVVELVMTLMRQKRTRQRERIDRRKFTLDAELRAVVVDETDVKGRVMRGQRAVADELQKLCLLYTSIRPVRR